MKLRLTKIVAFKTLQHFTK